MQSGDLDKAEIRKFILRSLQRGRFAKLFEAEDREMMKVVDQMFNWIFADKFDEGEDDIDTYTYQDAINQEIEGDGLAQPLLDLFDPTTKETVTRQDIRDGLKNLLRKNVDDYKENVEEHEEKLNEIIEKSGGKFA